MKKILIVALMASMALPSFAQDEDGEKKGGFKKDRLFTGGSLTLSFSNNGSVLGAAPVFGYRITNWLDAGVVANFVFNSVRHVTYYSPTTGQYFYSDDKLRQFTYGPGAFIRVYPINFLFAQAQVEHNFISQKLIFDDGSPSERESTSATSILVGAGYATGRQGSGDLFYYVSILFDVNKDPKSPYVEQTASGSINVLPIIRAGLQVPLFQGKKRN